MLIIIKEYIWEESEMTIELLVVSIIVFFVIIMLIPLLVREKNEDCEDLSDMQQKPKSNKLPEKQQLNKEDSHNRPMSIMEDVEETQSAEKQNRHINHNFCPNCGNKVEDDSKFCRYCGTKLTHIEKPVDELKRKDFYFKSGNSHQYCDDDINSWLSRGKIRLYKAEVRTNFRRVGVLIHNNALTEMHFTYVEDNSEMRWYSYYSFHNMSVLGNAGQKVEEMIDDWLSVSSCKVAFRGHTTVHYDGCNYGYGYVIVER